MSQRYGVSIDPPPQSADMTLAKKLHHLCGQRKWTQADLRRAIGDTASASIVSDWFKGDRKPNLDAAVLLAKALEVSLDWLADDATDMPPQPREAAARPLGPKEAKLLELADMLGYERAKNRLLGIITPEDVRPAQWD